MRTYKEQWVEILSLPWAERQAKVADVVRAALTTLDAYHMSTAALVDYLWPASEGEPKDRAYLYRSIMLQKDTALKDCAEKGPPKPKKFMGKVVHTWLWTKPRVPTHCPTCGRAYSQEAATGEICLAPEPSSTETPLS